MIKKYLKKKINGIKICAVITTVCFMVSTLGSNLYAIPMSENANKKYEDVFNKASSISSEYGKITALKDANSTVTVVNIQDLHCHAQTQRNISKIIEQLARKYNLKRIYVEGGYGNIDTSWLNSVKDENVKKQVIEELLEQGILTGSEYYKITSGNKEIELKGIDEEKLHKENIKRLSWMIDNQSKYKKLTENIDKEIELLEKKYVNSENKRFSTNIEKYTKNEIDTKRFYRQLIKYVKDINNNPHKYNNVTAINLDDYPNIMKFMKLTKISQKMKVKEITSQLYMVINDIKTKLPYNVYTKFVEETGNFQDSQKLVELISLLCNKAGIDLDNKYSSLKIFLESNELNRNLNSVELVQEERHLIGQIRAALSYSNEEYEITYVSDFSSCFKDYLEYKLMEGDWLYFKQGFAKFRSLYGKYAVTDRIKEIEQDFSEINNYYEINDKRNDVFVNNLLENENPQLLEDKSLRQEEEVLAGSKDVIIAVTGGFHSQALEEILQAKEVNTIVITPSIYEGIDKATKVYKGIIKDQSKQFQSQALAYTIASCQTDKNKQNILLNVVKDIVGTNSDKIREILGTDVDLSKLDNIEQLTPEEQKDASLIKQILSIEANSIAEMLPVEGGKTILLPDMDKLIIAVSKELVDIGIFLSDGAIFDIENSGLNGKELKGIPAEIYSRMSDSIQKALFKTHLKEAVQFYEPKEKRNFAAEIFKYFFKNTGSYGELLGFGIDALKIIVDSLGEEDSDFIENYLLNPKYKEKYKVLFNNLKELEITNVATENNYLALKLFVDKKFNELIDKSNLYNNVPEDKISVMKYYSAIAVSRFIFDSIGEEIYDYDFENENFIDIIENVTALYIDIMNEMLNITLLDSNTKIYALCNSERVSVFNRFNVDTLQEILNHMELPSIPQENIYTKTGIQTDTASKWLKAIENFVMDKDKTKGYFVFRGHGDDENLLIFDPYVKNGLAVGFMEETISFTELTDSLFKLATRDSNPIDLRNITIDLSCCESYYFARNVYSLLDEKYAEYNKTHKDFIGTYPTIITAAGLETRYSDTSMENTEAEGNLHKGMMASFEKQQSLSQERKLSSLSLGMIGINEYLFERSNITIFTSFKNEELLDKVEREKTKIKELYSDMQKSKKASKKMKKIETALKNKDLQQISPLPKHMVEASILSPIKNSIAQAFSEKAHIWEEILFRAVPAIITVINPVIGIPLFLIMQPLFVFSHTIVKWVVQKDSAGTDKKAKFVKLLQTDVRDLSKPALLFIAPYVLSLAIAIVNPLATLFFIPISSSLSQYGHYRYNQIVREQNDQKSKILDSVGSLQDELRVVDQQIKATFVDSIDKYEGMTENEQKEAKIKQAIVSNLAKFEDIILQMNKIENEVVAKLTELDTVDLSEEDIQECVAEIYKLQEKLDDTLTLLTNKMSYIYTDEVTRQHVLNVVEITKNIIEEKTGVLQISFEEEQYYKYLAVMNALLHDIGKDLTPEGILNTPRQLDDNEFAIMKMHTQKGAAVLEDERIRDLYAPFIYGAKYHHIRYVKDDKGIKITPRSYPVMTQEDQDIFNEALNSKSFNEQKLTFLIAVVDVYEALTAKRPYKEPMSVEEAFKIMRNDNGLTQENVELLAQVYMPEQSSYVADTNDLDSVVFASPVEIIKNKIKTMKMNILAPVADKGKVLSDNAHIWEEIVFRAVPAIIALINPVIGIPLFLVMQPLFIFSHTIVKWLVQKDSSGEEKLSFKEIAKNDFKNLALPTVAMSLPYVIAFALPMFAPFATVLSAKIFALFAATVTAQVSHYEYNKVQDSDKNLSIMPKISSLVIYNGSKLNDILNQNVVVTTKSGSMHILNFSPKTVSSAGRYLGGIQKGEYSSYGIENVEYDNEGNIVSVTFKEGTTVSTLKQDGQPLSSQENNIDFSQEQLAALYSDTDTSEYMDIYLDGDSKDINRAIKEAAENNKLIVFHLFKEGFNTFEMSPSQIYENYQKAYSLISNQVHLSEIFPDLNKDKEHTDFSLDFFFQEMMKNAFVHGNLGNFEYPIAVNIKLNEEGTVETLTVYNGLTSQKISKESEFLANSSLLFGDHMGSEIMRHNPVRTYSTKEESLNDIRFWKATTSVRDTIDESNVQWEYDYKHPKQKTHQEMLEDFWGLQTKSTVERLYDTGFNKYLKQYLKQTGKLEKDITQEEIMEIEEKAKHYRYTFPGLVNGVFLETFALFSKDFIAAHGNMSFGMKIVVWTIRALSVGLGITAAVCTFSVLPLSSVLLVAAISSVVGAGSVISSGFIIHLVWNTFAVITNTNLLLQEKEEITEEEIPVNAKNRIYNNGKRFNIEDFLSRKNIQSVTKDNHQRTFDFVSQYEMPSDYEENYRIKKVENYFKQSGKPSFKDKGRIVTLKIDIEEDYVLVDESDNQIEIERGSSKFVKIRRIGTEEEITIEFNIINGRVNSRVSNYKKTSKGNIVSDRVIEDGKDSINYIDPDLEKEYGIKEISYKYNELEKRNEVTITFKNGDTRTVKLPQDDSKVYLYYDNNIFCFNRHYCAPIRVYKVDSDVFKNISHENNDGKEDEKLYFDFNSDIAYVDITRKYKMDAFTNRNFVIEKSDGEKHMLYFDSEEEVLYEIISIKENKKVKISNFRDYGIITFSEKGGKITELILEEGTDIRIDVRQPIEIDTEEKILSEIESLAKNKNIVHLDTLPIEQLKQLLKKAGLSEDQIENIDFSKEHPLQNAGSSIREAFFNKNYQGTAKLEDIDFKDPKTVEKTLRDNPIIYAMFIETLIRTFDAMNLQDITKIKINEKTTLEELIKIIDELDIDKKFFETQIRGYFGEVYCIKTIVVGMFDGLRLRLQMPDDSNEPGIDLVNPVTGLKIQVKSGDEKIVDGHLSKNWQDEPSFAAENFGLKKIPVLTLESVKEEHYKEDRKVQSFGIDTADTITHWIKYLFGYDKRGENLSDILDGTTTKDIFVRNLEYTGIQFAQEKTLGEIIKELEEKQIELDNRKQDTEVKEETEVTDTESAEPEIINIETEVKKDKEEDVLDDSKTGSGSAILPKNMAVVNESLQKGESAIKVAAKIAIAEIKDSLLPDFVERHESQAGKAGAAQIREFLDKYMPVAEKASKISARLGRIVEKMIIGASVVKHIAIDYKFIKSSGIQDAIKIFGTNAKLSEEGKIEIGIVEDIEEANKVYELENTGIKINGSSIYRVAGSDLLLYGAKGNSAVKVAQVINGTNTIKEEIKKILNKEGIEADEIETEGIVRTSKEGIGIKEGLLEIGEMELEGKTAKQINTFITSSLEVKRAIGIMFAQKTIVGLESITDVNKLKIAIENGRTRKVITEEQYKMLNMTKEEIDGLREQGIEIYIDGNESKKEYMENGISGQIIREADGVKIRDYYMQEDVEIKEILTEQESVEQALVNQEKPVLVDIEILKKQFKSQRDITNIQRELGALLGKIKVNMKIGELTANDIENMGYNVSFDRVPQLKEKELEDLMRAETKDDVISLIGAESEFAIILKSIKTKELTQTFIELIKERILAKKSLLESKNELEGAELQEKKQEIMLGKMLYRQIKNKYSDTKEVDMDDVTGANATAKLMENIEKLKGLDSQNKSKDTREQEVLVNTIIEIILYDGKRVKGDVIKEQKSEDMSKTYRAMLAAA